MPRKLTNKKNLPLPLYLAIKNDTYESRGDISTTTLIDAPLPRILKKYNTYEEDAAEMIWALYGQAVHAVVERVGNAFEGRRFLPEEKLMIKTAGHTYKREVEVSGTSDLLESDAQMTLQQDGTAILHDFKNIFVWTAKQGSNSSSFKKWTLQCNIYRFMIWKCLGVDVREIFVHAFIRDWNRSKSEYTTDYPEYPVETFKIPVYSFDSILKYIKTRIDLHFPAEENYKTGFIERVPVCDEEDRWTRSTVWKMMKVGGKRSLKNFTIKDSADEENAKAYYNLKSKEKGIKLIIDIVPGEDVRCINYCPVNSFCSYYKATYGQDNKRPEVATVTGTEVPVVIEEQKATANFELKF